MNDLTSGPHTNAHNMNVYPCTHILVYTERKKGVGGGEEGRKRIIIIPRQPL